MSRLEGCIELGPVGNICFLEDGFRCLGVFLESVCLRAESKIGHDHVATSLEQAEGEGEREMPLPPPVTIAVLPLRSLRDMLG